MIINKNSKGFGAVEALIILVVMSLIGGAAWYIGKQSGADKSKNAINTTTKNEASKTKEKAEVDEAASWLLYKASNNTFEMRLADGWDLNGSNHEYNTGLTAYGAIDYKPGVKAKVTESIGGRGGPFTFNLVVSDEERSPKRGIFQREFKTNSGLVGQKYVFVQQADETGPDLQKGEKEYTYYFSKNGKYIYINHSVFHTYKDNVEVVEKSIKTLKIN